MAHDLACAIDDGAARHDARLVIPSLTRSEVISSSNQSPGDGFSRDLTKPVVP